jgi:hypothetical protein
MVLASHPRSLICINASVTVRDMIEHQFEPMSVGMVLDRSFRLYTENFPLMLGITAILNLPILLLTAFPLFLQATETRPLWGLLIALSSVVLAFATLLVIYPLVTGATTKAVSDKYLGNPVTIGSALKEAWGCVGTLLLTQWVAGIIVVVGFLLLIVPGILWTLSYTLIAPVVMIEATDRRTHQVQSLTGVTRTVTRVMDRSEIRRRSWELVKGNRGKVFVIILVLFVLRLVLSLGATWVTSLGFAFNSVTGRTVQNIISQCVAILTSPLQTIAVTLLYYDLRIRKEGFDLDMLSQAMGTPRVDA